MGLSTTEKNKIVQLLGYGGKTIQPGSVIYNKILNDRLDQLLVDTENLVRTYLSTITVIESQMAAAPTRLIAKKVGDIELNNKELEDLRRERRRISREIAAHLDVPFAGSDGVNISVSV